MKKIQLLLLLVPALVAAQPKFEIQEFTGIVKSIEPGWGFAYERIRVDVDGKAESFLFHPDYGKFIIESVMVNSRITLRVNVNLTFRNRMKALKSSDVDVMDHFSQERIVEIQIRNEWKALPVAKNPYPGWRGGQGHRVFLEKNVIDVYKLNDLTKAVIFQNGLIGSFPLSTFGSIKDIKGGDVISFMGYSYPRVEGAAYPVSGVKEVYFFTRLYKNTGHIKSYLFKQNSVCLGMVMETENGDVAVGFPSDYAARIKNFLSENREVDFFHFNYKVERLLNPPELHGLISGKDTLLIEKFGFYGGEDVQHDHQQAVVSGTISRINRSDKGEIMSVMVGNDVYVEVDLSMAQQLGQFIKKGNEVVIAGEERIRKEGEVYNRDFRIITPRNIKVEGKEFLLK